MENTRQPIPLRIRQYLRDAVGRMHPSVSFVSCIGVLLAYLTGVYITGSLHEASRWMGAMLACTSLVVVLQSHSYKESLRAGWTRVLGTFLGALIAYIYLENWPFSIVGMLASVFVLEMLCMLVGIYQNNRIATITLLIIRLADDAPRLAGRKLPATLYRIGRRRRGGRCAVVGTRTVETMARTARKYEHTFR